MSRTRIIGGKLTEIIGGDYNIYSEGDIVYNSGKTITFTGEENGVTFGEPERPKLKEKVISIESELFMHNNQELKIPYLDSSKILNYISSKPFIAGIRSIFGRDIKHIAAKKLMKDLLDNKLIRPKWVVNDGLSDSQGGFYHNGSINISERLIFDAEKNPDKSWLLFRVVMEEISHYIDDLLRNKYDKIGGDDPRDEGVLFTADFIKFNDLLLKDFEFAKIKIKTESGDVREFRAKVMYENPNIEKKAKDLLFVEKHEDDHGTVTLKTGEKINVEFFKIRGGGAIHEDITKRAAKRAGVIYDHRLDEGCAWPDVPCDDENSAETCYWKTYQEEHKKGTMAYESHHGSKQYWHSMSPAGNHTNQEVINLIVEQAKNWFKNGIETEGEDGLFHIGKILHMVQDSYSLSHVQRDKDNKIIQFQGYDAQDADKHGNPDKDGKSQGVKDAEDASTWILSYYKGIKEQKIDLDNALPILEKYFREEIYNLALNRGEAKAGGSLDAYKKKEIKISPKISPETKKWIEEEKAKMMREPKF
jgi:hypothetical protein